MIIKVYVINKHFNKSQK